MKAFFYSIFISSIAFGQAIPRNRNMSTTSILSQFQTTAPLDLYVSTSGNDANSCTSPSAACLTIQGACNKIPSRVLHPVVVALGSGTFGPGCSLEGHTFGSASSGIPGSIKIIGTLSVYASGTLDFVANGLACTSGVFTDSTKNFAVDELKGKLFQVTVSGTTHTYPISTNSATAITIAGILPTPQPAAGATYTISDRATIVSDVLGYTIQHPGPAAGASNKTSTAASFVLSNGSNGYDADSDFPPVSIERIKFSYASVKQAFWLGGTVSLRENDFSTNSQVALALTNLDGLTFSRNTIDTTQAGLNLGGNRAGITTLIQFFNNVIVNVSDATVLQTAPSQKVVTKFNSITNSGYRLSAISDFNSVCDTIRPSTGRCIDLRGIIASNSCTGFFNFDGLDCQQTNPASIQAVSAGPGSCTLTFDRNAIANSSITTGGGTGGLFTINGGARIVLGSGTTLTSAIPSNNDFTLTDGASGVSLTVWNSLVTKSLTTHLGTSISVSGASLSGPVIGCDDTNNGCADSSGDISNYISKMGTKSCVAGTLSFNFTNPIFSRTPYCQCASHSATASNGCTIPTVSSTGITVNCVGATDSFDYICTGMR